MERLKGLFVKKREAPKDGGAGSSMAGRVKGLFKKSPMPAASHTEITSYDKVNVRVGMRPPALKLHSADPYGRMEARSTNGGDIPLLPSVPYPICWQPSEQWGSVLDESEKHIKFQIPLGRTWTRLGVTKDVEIEAWALIPIPQMPYGWSRIGIIGREQFDLDVVSADFDTRLQLTQDRYTVENTLRRSKEAALMEIVNFTRGMPESQRTPVLNDILNSLRLGGIEGLRNADDPEALIDKKINELVMEKKRIKELSG